MSSRVRPTCLYNSPMMAGLHPSHQSGFHLYEDSNTTCWGPPLTHQTPLFWLLQQIFWICCTWLLIAFAPRYAIPVQILSLCMLSRHNPWQPRYKPAAIMPVCMVRLSYPRFIIVVPCSSELRGCVTVGGKAATRTNNVDYGVGLCMLHQLETLLTMAIAVS